MINLKLLEEHPELAKSIRIEITGSDFIQVAEEMTRRAVESEKARGAPKKEEYLTSEETAKLLKISLVTLWSWDRKGITTPRRVGNLRRYRLSDLEKMLSE